MKPAAFTYEAPQDLAEALLILDSNEDARVLAGGQTLVPMMAFRVARPPVLVDINRIAELDFCEIRDGSLCIGALTRHQHFHVPVVDGPLGSLLSCVVKHIAHIPIRARGTFCGSIAHADPSSEWCLTAVTLDASLVLLSSKGERVVKASEFFEGFLATAIEPGEMIREVRIPLLQPDTKFGFYEFSRRAGDYALAVCLFTARVQDGRIVSANIGLGGVEGAPRRIAEAEEILIGEDVSLANIQLAASKASEVIDPLEDAQADAPLRIDLAKAVVERAMRQAFEL